MGASDRPSEATASSSIHDLWVLGRGLRSSPRMSLESIGKFAFDWKVQNICPHNSRAIARRGLNHSLLPRRAIPRVVRWPEYSAIVESFSV